MSTLKVYYNNETWQVCDQKKSRPNTLYLGPPLGRQRAALTAALDAGHRRPLSHRLQGV